MRHTSSPILSTAGGGGGGIGGTISLDQVAYGAAIPNTIAGDPNFTWDPITLHFNVGDYADNINGTYLDVNDAINEISGQASKVELGDIEGFDNATSMYIDDTSNEAGFSDINGNGIFYTGQNSTNSYSPVTGLQIYLVTATGGEAIYTLGDAADTANGTTLIINDTLMGIAAQTNGTFTVQNTTGNAVVSAVANPSSDFAAVSIGDLNGYQNSTTFGVDDSGQEIAGYTNGIFQIGNVAETGLVFGLITPLPAGAQYAQAYLGDINSLNNNTIFVVDDSGGASVLGLGTGKYIFNSPNFNIDGVPYVFPSSQGFASTVLTNDGSGNLSWSPASTGFTNPTSITSINSGLSPYTVLSTDNTIDVDTSGGDVEIDLPALSAGIVRTIYIQKISNDNNTVTIVPNGTDLINQDISYEFASINTPVLLDSVDTTQWLALQATGISSGAVLRAKAATTANLGTITYNNGASGIGATITNAGVDMAFPAQDTITINLNDRVLVKNQPLVDSFQDGIYSLTTVGNGSTPWVLTRTTDSDTTSQLNGQVVLVTSGATQKGLWQQVVPDPVVGVTLLKYVHGVGNANVTQLPGTQVAGQLPVYTSVAKQVTAGDATLTNMTIVNQLGSLIGADMNTTADQLITLNPNFSTFIVTDIVITNPSTDLTGMGTTPSTPAQWWTGASRSGTLIATTNIYGFNPNNDFNLLNVASNYISSSPNYIPQLNTVGGPININNYMTQPVSTCGNSLYFSLITTLGSAGTADIYIYGYVLN